VQPWFPTMRLDNVRVVTGGPVCWFVRSVLRRGAMTFSPFVFYGRAAYDPATLRSLGLLVHELKHIEQYRRYGHAVFLVRYFWAMGRNRFRYSHDLPLEAEAYAIEAAFKAALES